MKQNTSPISFKVNVARLPKKGMPVVIEASEAERAELARAHHLVAVDTFRAELTVLAWKRNGVSVQGSVVADIIQSCVVTLEPLAATVDEAVAAVFLPEDSKLGRELFDVGGEIMIDLDGPDSPEIFSGDSIDVGALAEEFFGLGIDPYPRREDAGPATTRGLEQPEEKGALQQNLRKLFPES